MRPRSSRRETIWSISPCFRRNSAVWKSRDQAAWDLSADGSAAVVLTYGQVLLFPRKQSETWATAFAREPVMLPPHNLTQAEATCFSVDGRAIYVASEKTRQLLRYDLR